MAADELATYLNDHLAGSTTGVELARRLQRDHQGTPLGTVMAELAEEVEQDRATLQDLMERLGVDRSTLRQAAGAVAERLARLRTGERLTGSPHLSRLLETELLSLGVEGKLLMWKVLAAAAAADARLAATDFGRLIDRARSQRERLEPHRLAAAAAVVAA